jgi:hypothetical protein
MSALETTVRVTPEKQTLILAGENDPPRGRANSDSHRPLTIVATRADETLLLMQDGDTPTGSALIPLPRNFPSHGSPANAYLNTQALTAPRSPAHLIDVYA